MSSAEYRPVTFNAGSPIDVNLLNRLQENISSIKVETDKSVQNATVTVGNVQKTVKVTPIIFAGSVIVAIKNNRGYEPIDLSGANFKTNPIVVASVETNTSPGDQVTLRATATSSTGGAVEVFTASASKLVEVKVNFIAVEMKQV